jgi:hypothetical protein
MKVITATVILLEIAHEEILNSFILFEFIIS